MLCKEIWGGTCAKKVSSPKYDCGEGHINQNSPSLNSDNDIKPLLSDDRSLGEFSSREERAEELLKRLADGASSFCESDQWKKYLDFFSGFRSYSANNIMLALFQNQDISLLASYDTFAKKGRKVKKGESAIWILAPLKYTKKTTEEYEENGVSKTKEVKKSFIKGFTSVPVFDVSQTEGDEIPSPVSLLKGQAPEMLEEAMALLPEKIGFSISYEDFEGRANGYCDFTKKKIVIRESNDPMQRVKTIAHEMGHALLHGEGDSSCRGEAELEAESVAYVVCGYLGVDSSEYSFGYLASWKGHESERVLSKSATRIKEASNKILDLVEQNYQSATGSLVRNSGNG